MLNIWFLHNVYLYNFSTKKHMVYLKELSGMGKLRKMISVLLSINIFSLLALPPLGGFIGKMYFAAFLAKTNPIFTFLFLLFGVISALYYLRLIKII
jgi:NADH:ubiquinone oxidoreductase subunit 2 (subunit N)